MLGGSERINVMLSAPLSPAVSKVSAGAMEVMDIFETKKLVNFLKVYTISMYVHNVINGTLTFMCPN